MKRNYKLAQLVIRVFDFEDIITSSGSMTRESDYNPYEDVYESSSNSALDRLGELSD